MWNHHLKEYRDRNLRQAKLSDLMEQFEEQFIAAEMKQQWHNLLTNYKKEKQCEERRNLQGLEVKNFTHLAGHIIIQCHSLAIPMVPGSQRQLNKH